MIFAWLRSLVARLRTEKREEYQSLTSQSSSDSSECTLTSIVVAPKSNHLTGSKLEALAASAHEVLLDPYKSELKRYLSFKAPWKKYQAIELSKAGFYSFGYYDKVICAYCRGVLGSWEPTDIPIVEHARHYPSCPFLQSVTWRWNPIGEDVCGPF